ncbi:MAG TPA: tail fiber protein [Symbiobacteriaceae bacterium]|nr:tail fiber protein [Symbiobacteriaceae bacterium]
MADPFVAEIRIVGFNFAPRGWAFCDGQLMPISQNTALFSLLGTTYGGNGKSNFALPDLQGKAPMHPGQGPGLSLRDLGESAGTSTVTLLESEMPVHTHATNCSSGDPTASRPNGMTWSKVDQGNPPAYGPLNNPVTMHPWALGPTGGSLPHNNSQPYLTLNFIIALQGVFPPRS